VSGREKIRRMHWWKDIWDRPSNLAHLGDVRWCKRKDSSNVMKVRPRGKVISLLLAFFRLICDFITSWSLCIVIISFRRQGFIHNSLPNWWELVHFFGHMSDCSVGLSQRLHWAHTQLLETFHMSQYLSSTSLTLLSVTVSEPGLRFHVAMRIQNWIVFIHIENLKRI
jgi:hypothetical protein